MGDPNGLQDLLHDPDQAYTLPPPQAKRGHKNAADPSGWGKPHVRESGDEAEIVTAPMVDTILGPGHATRRDHDLHGRYMGEDELIAAHGLDPAAWEIAPPVDTTRWQQHENSDEWLYRYRLRLERVSSADRVDYDELVADIRDWSPGGRRPANPRTSDVWLVVNIADVQAGKADGDGTPGTFLRLSRLADQVEWHVKQLRAMGIRLSGLIVVGLGDMVEGCTGWYPQQLYSIDLPARYQRAFVRRMLYRLIAHWSRLVPAVRVTTVGGNHGENRTSKSTQGGVTTDADNADVEVFDSLADMMRVNRRFDHVQFHVPDDQLIVTLDVAGTVCAWSHGHLSPGGKAPLNHWQWVKDKAGAMNPEVHDARILTFGHFHHYVSYEPTAARVINQCPPLDGGSKGYRDRKGVQSRPGILTYLVDAHGMDWPRVLYCERHPDASFGDVPADVIPDEARTATA